MAGIWEWMMTTVKQALTFVGLVEGKPRTTLFVGLDSAGKTSLTDVLLTGRMSAYPPTIQPTSNEVRLGSLTLRAFDVGGHEQARHIWAEYASLADGIVFIVDAARWDRFEEAREELQGILGQEEVGDTPILILGNKIDNPDAADADTLSKELGVDMYRTGPTNENLTQGIRPLEIFMCSLKLRQGYGAGLNWLAQHMS